MKLENELAEPQPEARRPTLAHVALSGRDDEDSAIGPTVISASSVAVYARAQYSTSSQPSRTASRWLEESRFHVTSLTSGM